MAGMGWGVIKNKVVIHLRVVAIVELNASPMAYKRPAGPESTSFSRSLGRRRERIVLKLNAT